MSGVTDLLNRTVVLCSILAFFFLGVAVSFPEDPLDVPLQIDSGSFGVDASSAYVPPSLEQWVGWVQDSKPDLICALRSKSRVCVWPSFLKIEVGAKRGHFDFLVTLDRTSEVTLPGGDGVWPLQVRDVPHEGGIVGGDDVSVGTSLRESAIPVVVLARSFAGAAQGINGARGLRPTAMLEPGTHRLSGYFSWEKRPKFLQIPGETALIQLRINGTIVKSPKLSNEGMLWLVSGDGSDDSSGISSSDVLANAQEAQLDRLSISVSRLLQDGHPFQIITNLDLLISGKVRSVSLGNVVPAGGKLLRVESPLSYRVEDGDRLTIEGRAGSYSMKIYSVYAEPPSSLIAPPSEVTGWPKTETWAWQAQEAIRSVEISGGTLVDPARTQVPNDWRNFPLYRLSSGKGLKLVERKRGVGEARPNELALARSLWLDQDGSGFSVRDVFTGTLNQGWRLDAQSALDLGRASLDGRDTLITESPDLSKQASSSAGLVKGVELRSQALSLLAESRMFGAYSSFSAVGWRTDVNSLSLSLFLPSGWRLLGASGADSVSNSWAGSWDLLGLFLILLLAGAIGKLFGWKNASLGLVAFVMFHEEWEAPFVCWFNLLLVSALLRVVVGKLKKYLLWYYAGSFILAVLATIPFILSQLLVGLYPQLAQEASSCVPSFDTSVGVFCAIVLSLIVISAAISVVLWVIRGFATKQYGKVFLRLILGFFAVSMLMSILSAILMQGLFLGGGAVAPAYRQGATPDVADEVESKMKSESYGLPASPPPSPRQVSKSAHKGGALVASPSSQFSRGQELREQMGAEVQSVIDPASDTLRDDVELDNESQVDQIDPNAKLQTGPGIPERSKVRAYLSWSGMVSPSQEVRLYLMGPWLNGLLSVLRVILALFLLRLFWKREYFLGSFQGCSDAGCSTVGSVSGVIQSTLLLFILGCPSLSRADDYPSPSLLTELETRLMRNKCVSDCTVASEVTVKAGQDMLEIEAVLQSRGDGSWAIPGPIEEFVPELVQLDGQGGVALLRDAGNVVWVRVPSGTHLLKVRGPIMSKHAMSLRFDAPAGHVSFSGEGWTGEGIDETGSVKGTLQISKTSSTDFDPGVMPGVGESGTRATQYSEFLAPWYQIHRTISLGVRNRVRVTVLREGATDQAAVVKLPVLSGESVLTPGFNVKGNYLEVNFARGQIQSVWESSLAETESLILEAPRLERETEVWSLDCSAIYRCAWTGLAPTRTISNAAYYVNWHPRPGEKVKLTVQKLSGVPGALRTIEKADIAFNVGQRLLDASVNLTLRSSDGGWHRIVLPSEVEISSASVNASEQHPLFDAGKLSLLLQPGLNSINLKFRGEVVHNLYQSLPQLDLGAPAVNVRQSVTIPRDNWILFTAGPVEGPAVLFWPQLILVLIAAYAFSRLIKSPLSMISWVLLGFGLVPLQGTLMVVPAIWFATVQWKRKQLEISARNYNLRQIGQVVFCVLTLICLYQAVYKGLILSPDSQVVGNNSSSHWLSWYSDRTEAILPSVGYFALPLWAWRAVMLSWSSWLVLSLLGWLRWGWDAFEDGGYWRENRECGNLDSADSLNK